MKEDLKKHSIWLPFPDAAVERSVIAGLLLPLVSLSISSQQYQLVVAQKQEMQKAVTWPIGSLNLVHQLQYNYV